uniref:arginine--tRNA ligase n=1 Tax=Corethron hystrix TaxID=216773 RepID=A0A7S1BFT6_9STRA|mmetsp:Transcript_26224/g.60294  ORF Transcript_26224/g.60294 Transcript_26224/m.60294 type:complete len:540 (+) Transcript_26224:125-1744(+)
MAPSKNITKLYLHAPSGPTSQNHPGPCLSLSKLSSLLRCSSILPLDVVSIVPIHSPPSSADECVLSRTSSPVLYAADDTAVGGGGGNVLLKAVALMASVDITGEVEEWLEFEENVVVPALILGQGGGKAGDAALKILESKVKEVIKKGNYLVGESMTLADIALVTTLSIALSVTPSLSLGPSIKSYLAGHSSSLSSGDLSHLLPGPPLSTLSLSDAVSKVFASALELAFPQVESFGIKVDAKRCTNLKFGDYQCNNAMVLFKKLKESGNTSLKSPQNVAQQILQAVDTSNPVLDQLAVTGPGFIMCRIRGSFLSSRAQRIAQEGKVSPPVSSTEKRVVVDFSSPNIAKEMHVGHLRSTIIGESVCRILEYCGSKVMRVNHVGDWGTQFGMLIQYLKEEYPNFETDQPNITDLTMFYKNAKERFDKDADFKKISQLNVVALQSGDPTCLNIWKILCDISRIEFQKVYKRLDVSVEECGESFYNDKIAPVIKEFEEKKLISVSFEVNLCLLPGHTHICFMTKNEFVACLKRLRKEEQNVYL